MKIFFCTVLLAFLGLQLSFAQVGVGTTTPDPNAALDVESTTQGVLIPRMTKAQRELIGSGTPATGLLVYQTDDVAGFYFYDGTAWVSLTTAKPSGLEAVDEGNGVGLVKVGRNPAHYGNVGLNAVDLSHFQSNSTGGATGNFSSALGFATTASGDYSSAIGHYARAQGDNSTAIGYLTVAESYGQTTLGTLNVPTTPISTTVFNELDQLFVVGNGFSFFPSNALTILKNGTITAPSFDISEITEDKALITKEYGDTFYKSSGLENLDSYIGNGLSIVNRDPFLFGFLGYNAVDLSFAEPWFPESALAGGATGAYSFAAGLETTSSGDFSTTMGSFTTAESYGQTTLGIYNVPVTPNNENDFDVLDQLFVIGNGLDLNNPSNAFKILKNGTITAPSFDISEITDAKALVTKEYADANYADTVIDPTGFEAIDQGNGNGLARVGRNPNNYGDIGYNAIDMSYNNFFSNISGATGLNSISMGNATTASGDYSTALGIGTTAESYGQTTLGFLNVPNSPISATTFNGLDQLLVVGNGVNFSNPSNALSILKNGTITAPSFDLTEITDSRALVTKEYADAFLEDSGLESIDETMGVGLVRKGRNPNHYGNVGLNAVDLSYSVLVSSEFGATGTNSHATGTGTKAFGQASTAMGSNNQAIGNFSTAMGANTQALGDYSMATGRDTKALEIYSTSSGFFTEASGAMSTAIGLYTKANALASTAVGAYNIGGGDPTTRVETDPIFEVGNGIGDDVSDRSNALTVLKNGTITAPSFDISEITEDKALITKEYADANYIDAVFSGDYNDLSSLPSLFNGDYNSLINLPTLFSGSYNDLTNLPTIISPSGLEAINEGNGIGFARVGRVSANYGNVGLGAIDFSDSGTPSTTRGATGPFSVAMGGGTTALGIVSTAIGNNTTASGIVATAMGDFTIASGDYSTAMGNRTRAEAFASTAIGRYNVGGGNPTSNILTDPVFEIGNGTSNNFRSNALTVLKNGNATLAGNLTENSDFRLKKNIQPLENSLVKLLKLEGKNYYWNDLKPHSKDLQIGLIAQELETVFPELVHTGSDGYKSVDYTSLIPVIIEATKSQQEIIDTQNKRIKALEEQNRILLALEARLKTLENDKNTVHVASASK